MPILTELQDTVRVTNGEIGRLGQVTDEVAVLSKNAASVSENAAQVSGLLTHAVGTPIIKVRLARPRPQGRLHRWRQPSGRAGRGRAEPCSDESSGSPSAPA